MDETEARLLDTRLGFEPAKQTIRITPQNCLIPSAVLHHHFTLTGTTEDSNCPTLNYYVLNHHI